MKSFSQFIQETEAAQSNIRSLEPFRVMPPLRKKDGSYNPSDQRYLINPKTGFGPGAQQAQLAPSKSILVGPNSEQLPHMDTRSPGQLLRNLQQQKKYYDSIGKNPPTV